MRLRLLLAGATHDVDVDDGASVGDLQASLLSLEGVSASTHRTRLITSGKLLGDASAPLGGIVEDGGFLHASVSEVPPDAPAAGRSFRVGRDEAGDVVLFIGDEDEEGEEGEEGVVLPSLATRGFDRLGFAAADVAELRRQFHAGRRRLDEGGEDVDAADIEEEEAWLSAALQDGGAAEEAEGEGRRRRRRDGRVVVGHGVEGSNTDFLLGCVCGYLLGVLTLALLLDKNISRRWRVGIVAGVATNAAFGVLRSSLFIQPGSTFPG